MCVTEVSGRVAGLFYACRFSNQEITKFCVVQVDFENRVINPVQVPSLPLRGSYILKKIIFFAFIYKTILRDNFATAPERTSQSDFKNEISL